MSIRFRSDTGGMLRRYDAQIDPTAQIEECVKVWQHRPSDEWVHLFIHTLDDMSKNWYIKTELRRGTVAWPLMVEGFQLTFKFESKYPEIDQALKVTKGKLLADCSLPVFETPKWKVALEQALACYNLAEEGEEDEDPHNINILESEGTHDVQGLELKVPDVAKPVKIKKVNIGTKEEPKFTSIGDYWDDETVESIADLLWD